MRRLGTLMPEVGTRGRRDGDGPTDARKSALRIRLVGPATEDGAIGFRELAELAGNVQSGIERVARLLSGRDGRGIRRRARRIGSTCNLRLVAVERGSVVLLARRPVLGQLTFEEMDIGARAIERFVEGLGELAADSPELPEGYDTGVLVRWTAIGQLLGRGIDRIELTLHTGTKSVTSILDTAVRSKIAQRVQMFLSNTRCIDGLLRMADFKEDDMKCRLYPVTGEPVLCEFDEDLAQTVHKYLRHWVRVRGWAEHDPTTGQIRRFTLHSVEPIPPPAAGERMAPPAPPRESGHPGPATFEALFGRGRDLWEDDDDFGAFIRGIYERRREDARS